MSDESANAGYTYEGYQLKSLPCQHVVFTYKCVATKEGRTPITGLGTTEDAAYNHAIILINQEVSNIGTMNHHKDAGS